MKQAVKFPGETGGRMDTHDALLGSIQGVRELVHRLSLTIEAGERAEKICADAASMRLRCFPQFALAPAAVYIACRELKVPVTLKELAEFAGCDVREVGRCYAALLEGTHITRPNLNGRSYLHRIAIRPLPDEVYRRAEEIVTKSTSAGVGGRNPMTLAAAALYMASCDLGEKVTQAEAAEAAGVAEESVRECCKAIRASTLSPQIKSRTRHPSGSAHVVKAFHK